MFFNGRIVIAQVLTHSKFKMAFSFVIIAIIQPKFKNNARTLGGYGIMSLNVKKLTNFAITLESKAEITLREFVFHYAI